MDIRRRATTVAVLAAVSLLLASTSPAAGPPPGDGQGSGSLQLAGTVASKISYQGRLTDAGGVPLNGNYNLVFQLWDQAGGGSQVTGYIECNNVPVSGGLFTVDFPLPQEVFNGQALWLQVQVNGQWLEPRQEMLPAPYAMSLRPGASIVSPGPGTLHVGNESGGLAVEAWSRSNIALLATNGAPGGSAPSGMHGVHGIGEGVGVYGQGGQTGVQGLGDNDGVRGQSAAGNAVHGVSTSGNGVLGESTAGSGVRGASSSDHGIVGRTDASSKSGVYGSSAAGKGVEGQTSSASEWVPAVYGKNQGAGDGVYGWSQNRHGTFGVTYSQNAGHAGLYGLNSGAGPGIYAQGGSNGIAAVLKGNVQVKSAATGVTLIELGEGLDYAEGFDVSDRTGIHAGTVLVIDVDNPGKLIVSTEAYDRKVAGVVAGAKGLGSAVRLGPGQFDYDVALAGRVYCNVEATGGEVSPGDLMTTSRIPGYAMVVRDHVRAQGAILGKAMQGLPAGERGQILILVTLQ